MSAMRYVRIERSPKTLSWTAICPNCKECVFQLTDEAVRNGPRREGGSSRLLPVTMSTRHECKALLS